MRAYRFKTKISETGVIQIPVGPNLYDKEVEIIIVPKSEDRARRPLAEDFVNKWAGFLANTNVEDSKYDYLSEKHK